MSKAKHEVVAGYYRRRIATGKLSPGAPMPTLTQVQADRGCSRNVAAAAYRMLRQEGLIATRSGSGTVVTARPRVVVTGAQRADRIDDGGPQFAPGETVTDRWAGMRSIADPVIAQELGVQPHDEAAVRRRVFRIDGTPTCFAITVIHARVLADVPEVLTSGPLGDWRVTYEERTGRKIGRSPERRGARHASPDELEALEVSVPADVHVAVPVLVTQTTYHDEDGPLFVMEDVYQPGAWQYDATGAPEQAAGTSDE